MFDIVSDEAAQFDQDHHQFSLRMGKGEIAKPPKKRRDITSNGNSSQQPAAATSSRYPSLNLADWIDSPILAKEGANQYHPGVIKSVPSHNHVEVSLDRQPQTRTYSNILDHSDLVISNHSAPAIMIKVGLNVCIKVRNEDSYFSLGTVKQINKGPPMQCLVQLVQCESQEIWVSRAGVRLIQPPWYDDLVDTGAQEVSDNRLTFCLDVL